MAIYKGPSMPAMIATSVGWINLRSMNDEFYWKVKLRSTEGGFKWDALKYKETNAIKMYKEVKIYINNL